MRLNGLRQMLKRLFIEARVYFRYSTGRKLLNLLRLQWQFRRKTLNAAGSPYRYYVEPTNACNLRCPFCFGWQERSRRRWGQMPLETFKSIIDQIAPSAYWVDLYNRGEPLLHPEICEMVSYANQQRIGTKISTNLNKLEPGTAEQLVKSGLDYLVVSIDGATQESYSSYRAGGDLEKLLSNLRAIMQAKNRLKSATPYITVRTIIMRQNEHELDKIKQTALEIGADNVIFVPMIVNMESESANEWLPVNPEYSMYDYEKRSNRLSYDLKACPELWQRWTINWDARVFPCCFADGDGEELGNLTESDISTIWNSIEYQASRATFSKACPSELVGITTVCTECRGSRKRQ
jgi:MoaA/NifB/PqqE/SkfB family radical SAM enzyme